MAQPLDVLIVGAGGHGAVVLEILRAAGQYRPAAFLDADPSLAGKTIHGVTVAGAMNVLPRVRSKIRHAIVAIGDNSVRASCAQKLLAAEMELVNAIHPSAVISPSATLGRNIVIAAGVVVGTAAKIGDSALLNTGCLIDHECDIGPAVHIAPGAKLAGRVHVGERAFVGIGACVIQCLSIGAEAIVGAGAVVIRDVAPHSTVVGSPARMMIRRAIGNT